MRPLTTFFGNFYLQSDFLCFYQRLLVSHCLRDTKETIVCNQIFRSDNITAYFRFVHKIRYQKKEHTKIVSSNSSETNKWNLGARQRKRKHGKKFTMARHYVSDRVVVEILEPLANSNRTIKSRLERT